MPVLGSAIMDTERMIPSSQNGSPGSQQNLMMNTSNNSNPPMAMIGHPNDTPSVSTNSAGDMMNGFHHPHHLHHHQPPPQPHYRNQSPSMPPPLPPTPSSAAAQHQQHHQPQPQHQQQQQQQHQPPHHQPFSLPTSIPRKKKAERAVPAINPAAMLDNSYANTSDLLMTPSSSSATTHQQQQQFAHNSMINHHGQGGMTNHAFAQEHHGTSNDSAATRLNQMTREPNVSMHEQDSDQEVQERIEVQVLPQDDNWGGRREAGITEVDYGGVDPEVGHKGMDKWRLIETDRSMGFTLKRHVGGLFATFVAFVAFISPILMVALPSMGAIDLKDHQMVCGVECDGKIVTLAFKLFALILSTYALFFRQRKSTLPRIHLYRALLSVITLLSLVAFWLFYANHVSRDKERVMYRGLVEFALNLVDCLFFILFLAVVLLKIRAMTAQYYVKVVRSPDGESRGFPIGDMSIQDAASFVLEKYYTEFPIYNPFLDRIINPGSVRSRRGVKVYDVDGHGGNINDGNSTVISVASKGRSERFHDEFEHDRKVRKRRTRLIAAAEEAFTHIKRINEGQQGAGGNGSEKTPMESFEAAQAIFPTLSRPLQKYLRATRQQPQHTMESILEHLSTCLSYDMSPRTFLEKYLVDTPVLQNDREIREVQSWSLVSEKSLYRDIRDGTLFQLRQGDVSLLCRIQRLPHYSLTEEIIEPKSNRFVLSINSETSV